MKNLLSIAVLLVVVSACDFQRSDEEGGKENETTALEDGGPEELLVCDEDPSRDECGFEDLTACPADAPTIGSACEDEGLSCPYCPDGRNLERVAEIVCDLNRWQHAASVCLSD